MGLGAAELGTVGLVTGELETGELLRLSTAGSVDDGKSTLIGRLLYDSKGAFEDQIASVRKSAPNGNGHAFDFALLTDGLRSEREQGITIDVAYRYFSTPKRKFIIADTPGHEQYTRNMATGASTANLAIILIDARNGVLPQSRRHAFIASLLGIRRVIVAVNKMDLVNFREDVFDRIRQDFSAFAAQLDFEHLSFLPISALDGDNVVTRSSRMPWFAGASLLEQLEQAPVASDFNFEQMRFPVQYVVRPNLDFRGYAGQVASGVIRPGDPVIALPSGRRSVVKSIVTYEGELPRAFPPMPVTICLEDEIDIGRGDMLISPSNFPEISTNLEAAVVWMNQQPLEPGKTYLLKHTTHQVRATITALRDRIDVNTLAREPAPRLAMNEIGTVTLKTNRPLFFDPYGKNRATGALILIDPITNETVGAGMIVGRAAAESENRQVTPGERFARTGHRGVVISVAGDEELAYILERKLFDRGCLVAIAAQENAAKILESAGVIAVCLAPCPASFPLDPASLPDSPDEAAELICRKLEARGVIGNREGPFTAGEGI